MGRGCGEECYGRMLWKLSGAEECRCIGRRLRKADRKPVRVINVVLFREKIMQKSNNIYKFVLRYNNKRCVYSKKIN